VLARETMLLCFLSHFQPCNVKNAGKLHTKTLAKGMCQSLFVTYSSSMRATRSFPCCEVCDYQSKSSETSELMKHPFKLKWLPFDN